METPIHATIVSRAKLQGSIAGFLDFIRAQGVVGLAIGVVLGGAVQKVVSSLVSDIVMPVITLVLGGPTMTMQSLSFMGVQYGHFIATLLDFAIIAAVIYFGVKGLGLEKMDKK
jgi:large conductance mechanosensitive channel